MKLAKEARKRKMTRKVRMPSLFKANKTNEKLYQN